MYICVNTVEEWGILDYNKVLEAKEAYKNQEIYYVSDLVDNIRNLTLRIDHSEFSSTLINLMKKCKKTTYIYLNMLDHYWRQLIKDIYKSGGIINSEDTKGVTYFTSTNGVNATEKCYYIKFKKNKNAKIYLYNYENILRGLSKDEIIKDFGDDVGTIEYSVGHAIDLLNKFYMNITGVKSMKSVCYTAPQYTKRIFGALCDPRVLNVKELNIEGVGNADTYIRNSYHGGVCLDVDSNTVFGEGFVIDINSLFLASARYLPMPTLRETPSYFKGKPSKWVYNQCKEGKLALFIRIKTSLRLRKDGIPFMRHTREYLEDTSIKCKCNDGSFNHLSDIIYKCDQEEFVLTYYDFCLMKQNYKTRIKYVDFIIMDTELGFFDKFIDIMYEKKRISTGGRRRVIKIIDNCLYGIYARAIKNTNIIVNDTASTCKPEEVESLKSTIHIGSYITSVSRYKWIQDIRRMRAENIKIISGDTDSIEFIGKEIPEWVPLNDKLGGYKEEIHFKVAIHWTHKVYMLIGVDNKVKFAKAGTPELGKRIVKDFIEDTLNASTTEELQDILDDYMNIYRDFPNGLDEERVYQFLYSLMGIVVNEEWYKIGALEMPVLYKEVHEEEYYYEYRMGWSVIGENELSKNEWLG